MTTTSSSTEALTPEKRTAAIKTTEKLHAAIVDWGTKHGLRAYRVITPTRSFFEIFNPNTGKISYDFPDKIQSSIKKYAAELEIYAADTRARDLKCGSMSHPGGLGSSLTLERQAPKGRDAQMRDCNGATRSESPIGSRAEAVQADGAVGGSAASIGGKASAQASKDGREVDFGS